ncbi:hypothetical protein BH23GEM6_BH23GEM6_26390 [soil metagenome]
MHAFSQTPPAEWSEERLRYKILRAVYEHAGSDTGRSTTATEIGTELSMGYEELFRTFSFLVDHGYLLCIGEGPRVCITPAGISYIEKAAGRRMTLRIPRQQSQLA